MKNYGLSLEQYEALLAMFNTEYSNNMNNLGHHGERYAPDLPNYGQKLIRANNLSVRFAVTKFMREYEFGVSVMKSVNEDVDHPWGYPVGHVEHCYKACDDYMNRKAFLIRELRSMLQYPHWLHQ